MRFVWVEGMRGPTPELWSDDYKNDDMQGKPRKIVIQKHEAPDAGLTLEELVLRHPLEKPDAV